MIFSSFNHGVRARPIDAVQNAWPEECHFPICRSGVAPVKLLKATILASILLLAGCTEPGDPGDLAPVTVAPAPITNLAVPIPQTKFGGWDVGAEDAPAMELNIASPEAGFGASRRLTERAAEAVSEGADFVPTSQRLPTHLKIMARRLGPRHQWFAAHGGQSVAARPESRTPTRAASVQTATEPALPAIEAPAVIRPELPPERAMQDPPKLIRPAPTPPAPKSARLGPKPEVHPAMPQSVHKAIPTGDGTPY